MSGKQRYRQSITTLIHARLFMCTKQQVCQVSPRENQQHAELSALVTATASTHAHVLSTLSEAFQQRSALLRFKAKLPARLHFLLHKHAARSLMADLGGPRRGVHLRSRRAASPRCQQEEHEVSDMETQLHCLLIYN